MKLRKVLALRGPNIWANFPVLEAWLDLEEYKESPSNTLPGFNDRIKSWLPTMIEHRCGIGVRGGFFQRLDTGTYPGHIIEHITLELQTLSGSEVGYGKARETSEDGVYRVVVEYHEETLARRALDTAVDIFLAAATGNPIDVPARLAQLTEIAHDLCLGPSTRSIVNAAVERRIPWTRLNSGSLVQLGYGSKRRMILTAETDGTSAIAEEIAQDKQLSNKLLRCVGVPVPEGEIAATPEEAWEIAQSFGMPVVVKPQFGNQGRGVAVNLSTREQVIAAFHAAKEEDDEILIESYIQGADWRLLVVSGQLVAAARREPAHVIGDGRSTIQQLIDKVNADPRRSEGHSTALSKLHVDAVALGVLRDQGYTTESIADAGVKVLIRRNANLSTGGTAEDVTEQVHPEVAARVADAARAVGLDIAGVDVVCLDISRPLEEQGGAVVEVNARPGLRMHLHPSGGKPQPVGEAIVRSLFPDGENGRVPIVSVTGVNGKTTTVRLIAHILRGVGKRVGMTTTDGIFVDRRRIDSGDCSGPKSARLLLLNPLVDGVVLETARGGILREGLGFDYCDVAVVTNIGEGDHLGLGEVATLEDLSKVKRCVVEALNPYGYAVLNAEDPHVVDMASYSKGKIIYFAHGEEHPMVVKHRDEGGRAVFVRHNHIVFADGRKPELELVSLLRVPLTHQGRIRFHVENVLAAAAAAWGLDLPQEVIIERLESFANDMQASPGRFNVLEIDGATVVVDYGHNVSALEAVIEAIRPFPQERRTALYSTAGDRRDEDMVRQGELLGGNFDRVILYEDHYTRGRQPGEIMGLFRQGIETQGGRVREIMEVQGAIKAMETALALVQPGELLLLQADEVDETVTFLRNYLENRAVGSQTA